MAAQFDPRFGRFGLGIDHLKFYQSKCGQHIPCLSTSRTIEASAPYSYNTQRGRQTIDRQNDRNKPTIQYSVVFLKKSVSRHCGCLQSPCFAYLFRLNNTAFDSLASVLFSSRSFFSGAPATPLSCRGISQSMV